ncbi:hemolysin family protein [Deinococcus roseus]|uniref:Hemolysin n=1 Tax=Deinococcus roseus TaxID=392414 RepID=A0ABQ2DEB9_9DEIO|nr:hemolysin family protein [Deinococcus roseus]GGJ51524.1 hemolysin [Deinococcus roseus]
MEGVVCINTLLVLLVVFLMVFLNALYVAAEFGLVSSRRSRLVEMVHDGHRPASRLLDVLNSPPDMDRYVAASQIGITLSSLIVGAYGQAQLTPVLLPVFAQFGQLKAALAGTLSILIVLVFLTALQVILGELLPKTIAIRYPERLALLTLKAMQVSVWLFTPLIRLFNGSATLILRRMGIQQVSEHGHVHSPEELEILFQESARGGLINQDEQELLSGVFSLEDKSVREVMVPRVRMTALEVNRSTPEVMAEVVKTPFTRFPVFEGNIDQIIGILNVRDLFLDVQKGPRDSIHHLLQPVYFVPDVLNVRDAWDQLREQRKNLAILTDEFGGISGMLTLEDIFEEVFGELQDEFDAEVMHIRRQGNDFLVRGDVSIHTVNSQLEMNLPDEDAYTISGLVWSELEQTPEVGTVVHFTGLRLRVEAMQGKQVTLVRLVLDGSQESRGEEA